VILIWAFLGTSSSWELSWIDMQSQAQKAIKEPTPPTLLKKSQALVSSDIVTLVEWQQQLDLTIDNNNDLKKTL
jgi:hypothetical protein